MSREKRLELIRAIEEKRQSKLVTYLTSDRPPIPGQIGQDAVRPMYAHLRALGFEKVQRIDLYLYSQGGSVDVPWRMITMLRECCKELNVLVPYKAHSAATLIALGADNIILCKKAELGPIDPSLTRTEQGEQTVIQERISVEDVMAFIAFIKERAGLGDQAALASNIEILIKELKPCTIGSIYRTHSHIRLIARKLLTSHKKPLDERQIDLIVQTLAEKIYSHGHSIGREEAIEIGLSIQKADKNLEEDIWQLFEAYEDLMKLNQSIDIVSIIPGGKDDYEEQSILACIESMERLDIFRGTLNVRHIRKIPPQLNLNLNLNCQLPAQIDITKLPENVQQTFQEVLQHILKQVQAQIPSLVQAELQKQAPIHNTICRLCNASWQNTTSEGI